MKATGWLSSIRESDEGTGFNPGSDTSSTRLACPRPTCPTCPDPPYPAAPPCLHLSNATASTMMPPVTIC
jgi:hypothetical protein